MTNLFVREATRGLFIDQPQAPAAAGEPSSACKRLAKSSRLFAPDRAAVRRCSGDVLPIGISF